jgi:RNA polymerase sigma-70 factor (ECF subfamily)
LVIAAGARSESSFPETKMDRAAGGSRIECLVKDNFASLWRLARRWGLGCADADDVAQRALVIASQRLSEIAEGRERTFLLRTAIFLASKVRRSHRRRPEECVSDWDETMDCGPNPEQLLEQRRARVRLDALLLQLPEDLRAVFVLFELEELSQSEIAETLGIPQGTVASRLRRARKSFMMAMNRKTQDNPATGVTP